MRSFLGVPYAQAAGGRPALACAAAAARLGGTREALQFGAECMQGAGRAAGGDERGLPVR